MVQLTHLHSLRPPQIRLTSVSSIENGCTYPSSRPVPACPRRPLIWHGELEFVREIQDKMYAVLVERTEASRQGLSNYIN